MPSLERLQDKKEDLEERYKDLRSILKGLRNDDSIESDSEMKYKLKKRIEERASELAEVEEQLEDLEEEINRHKRGVSDTKKCQSFDALHRALLKLGYWEQERLFEKISCERKESHAALLIHGPSQYYGQKWLLNRLVFLLPKFNGLENNAIRIDLNRKTAKSDIPTIWSDLARKTGFVGDYSSDQIIDAIYKLLQSQNVVIVFDNADETVKENLYSLVDQLWKSLALKISEDGSIQRSKLFLFFLDYQEVVLGWHVGFTDHCNSHWQSTIPLSLPDIRPFSRESLREWIEQQSDNLPVEFLTEKETTIQKILEEQGIPEPTLQKICELCGCNWSEQENKWLRI
jgi:hypothetical protein